MAKFGTSLLILMAFAIRAAASPVPVSPMERIQFVCSNNDVQYAFEGFEGRIWQNKPGEKEGLELRSPRFKQLGHLSRNWEIRSQLDILGRTMDVKLLTRTDAAPGLLPEKDGPLMLDVYISEPGEESFEKLSRAIPCKVNKKFQPLVR